MTGAYVVRDPSLARWRIRLFCRDDRGRLEATYASPCGGRICVTLRCRAEPEAPNARLISLSAAANGADVSFRLEELALAAVDDGLRAISDLIEQVFDTSRITVAPIPDCAAPGRRARRP